MDKETSQNLTDAEHVENMTHSDGWKVVKAKLDTRIIDLQNIYNLDMTDVNTIAIQLASRKMAVETIMAWLKADVYGFVDQQKQNNQTLITNNESYIDRDH